MVAHTREIELLPCLYKLLFISLSLCMFLICFCPWPYTLNFKSGSCKPADVSIIVIHVLCNLFWKICPLFGQILIMCLKCSRASFLSSFYRKRCAEVKIEKISIWQFNNSLCMSKIYYSNIVPATLQDHSSMAAKAGKSKSWWWCRTSRNERTSNSHF